MFQHIFGDWNAKSSKCLFIELEKNVSKRNDYYFSIFIHCSWNMVNIHIQSDFWLNVLIDSFYVYVSVCVCLFCALINKREKEQLQVWKITLSIHHEFWSSERNFINDAKSLIFFSPRCFCRVWILTGFSGLRIKVFKKKKISSIYTIIRFFFSQKKIIWQSDKMNRVFVLEFLWVKKKNLTKKIDHFKKRKKTIHESKKMKKKHCHFIRTWNITTINGTAFL